MWKIFFALALALPLFAQQPEAQMTTGDIKVLDGYAQKSRSALDATAWNIEGKNGFVIHFEAGPNEGSWADPVEEAKYSWYREDDTWSSGPICDRKIWTEDPMGSG